ncbi:MAG: hypothetical protein ABWX74_10360 [Aeromicrobium sp.]
MTGLRERPTEAEIDAWVSDVRGPVLARAVPRQRRRLRRSLIAGAVAGAVAAGGIAYAAVELIEPGRPQDAVDPDFMRARDRVRGIRPGPGGSVQYRAYEADGTTFVGWVDSSFITS